MTFEKAGRAMSECSMRSAERKTGRGKLWSFCILPSALCILAACQKTTPAPPPPPAAAPPAITQTVPPPAPAPAPPAVTIDDVRKLKDRPAEYEAALNALVDSAAPATKGRALALLGLFYASQKQNDSAIKALSLAADADPLVAPWLRLRVAELQRATGRNDDAVVTLRSILSAAAAPPRSDTGGMAAALH